MYDTPFYRDRKSYFETLPKSDTEIIFLGDSLTELCDWAGIFKNNKIENRGILGDTTEGVLNRIDNSVESNPHKLFILIGINDLYQGRTVKDILSTYHRILQIIQEKSPKTQVFVQSVLPVNPERIFKKGLNDKIVELNNALQGLAKKFGFHYIDLFSCFLDNANQLNDHYSPDGLHLNKEGYLIWKRMIEKEINEQKDHCTTIEHDSW